MSTSYTLADNTTVTVNTTANGIEFNEGMGALTKAIKAKITASSSGGASSGKLVPTLEIKNQYTTSHTKPSGIDMSDDYEIVYYDGDGEVYIRPDYDGTHGVNRYLIYHDKQQKLVFVQNPLTKHEFFLHASEGENYQAKTEYFEIDNE